jgi:hypothetical protein
MSLIERTLFTQPTGPWSASRYIVSALLVILFGLQLWLFTRTLPGDYYTHFGSLLVLIAISANHLTTQYPLRRSVFIAIRSLGYVAIAVFVLCLLLDLTPWLSR